MSVKPDGTYSDHWALTSQFASKLTKGCPTKLVANAMSALAKPHHRRTVVQPTVALFLSNCDVGQCQHCGHPLLQSVEPTTEDKNSKQNSVSASNFNSRQLKSSVFLHVTQWLPKFRRHYVLSKRREPNDSVTTQKTRILGNTAVRTLNIVLEM